MAPLVGPCERLRRTSFVGALNLFGPTVAAFTDQAITALTIMLRHASRIALDEQLREALATRATIDQAVGILIHAQKISSHAAFGILRHASQTSNRRVRVIAAEILQSMTGHPPEPPRPLSERA